MGILVGNVVACIILDISKVQITSVKYNGVEVFEGNENGKVFVRKPSQGETTVTVGSL